MNATQGLWSGPWDTLDDWVRFLLLGGGGDAVDSSPDPRNEVDEDAPEGEEEEDADTPEDEDEEEEDGEEGDYEDEGDGGEESPEDEEEEDEDEDADGVGPLARIVISARRDGRYVTVSQQDVGRNDGPAMVASALRRRTLEVLNATDTTPGNVVDLRYIAHVRVGDRIQLRRGAGTTKALSFTRQHKARAESTVPTRPPGIEQIAARLLSDPLRTLAGSADEPTTTTTTTTARTPAPVGPYPSVSHAAVTREPRIDIAQKARDIPLPRFVREPDASEPSPTTVLAGILSMQAAQIDLLHCSMLDMGQRNHTALETLYGRMLAGQSETIGKLTTSLEAMLGVVLSNQSAVVRAQSDADLAKARAEKDVLRRDVTASEQRLKEIRQRLAATEQRSTRLQTLIQQSADRERKRELESLNERIATLTKRANTKKKAKGEERESEDPMDGLVTDLRALLGAVVARRLGIGEDEDEDAPPRRDKKPKRTDGDAGAPSSRANKPKPKKPSGGGGAHGALLRQFLKNSTPEDLVEVLDEIDEGTLRDTLVAALKKDEDRYATVIRDAVEAAPQDATEEEEDEEEDTDDEENEGDDEGDEGDDEEEE